jgi:hypothetical protein
MNLLLRVGPVCSVLNIYLATHVLCFLSLQRQMCYVFLREALWGTETFSLKRYVPHVVCPSDWCSRIPMLRPI